MFNARIKTGKEFPKSLFDEEVGKQNATSMASKY